MFFQNYKKKGQVFGTEALTLLKMSFGLKFYDDPKFELPKAFFKDVYIDGFLTQFLQKHLIILQENKMWSTQNISDFTIEFYNSIDPSGTYASQTINNQRVSNIDKLHNDKDYKNGAIAASALIIVQNDLIQNYVNDSQIGEILKKVLDEVPKLAASAPLNKSLSPEENVKGMLITAVISLTLKKYIENNWRY